MHKSMTSSPSHKTSYCCFVIKTIVFICPRKKYNVIVKYRKNFIKTNLSGLSKSFIFDNVLPVGLSIITPHESSDIGHVSTSLSIKHNCKFIGKRINVSKMPGRRIPGCKRHQSHTDMFIPHRHEDTN